MAAAAVRPAARGFAASPLDTTAGDLGLGREGSVEGV